MEGIKCGNCGKIGEDVYFCSKYNDAAYCSVECRCLHSSHREVCSSYPHFCYYCSARVKDDCQECGLVSVCLECQPTHRSECGSVGLSTADVADLLGYVADNSATLLGEAITPGEIPSLLRILRFDVTHEDILFRDCVNSSSELSPFNDYLSILFLRREETVADLPVILQAIDENNHVIFETVITLSI